MSKNLWTALVLAFVIGGVEMRVAVARLETGVADVDRRVQRLETKADSYADAR